MLAVADKPNSTFLFKNEYHAKADVPLTATKELDGRTLKEKEFTFTLKGKSGDYEVDQTKQNAANGGVTFDSLKFAVNPTDAEKTAGFVEVRDLLDDQGEFEIELTVAEDTTKLPENVTAVEPTSYSLTVKVKYDESTGTLTAVADHITGTHISGYAFFNIPRRKNDGE